MRLNGRKRPSLGYSVSVSDSAFEYGGVPAARLAVWEEILRDVGFARELAPAHRKPGHDDHQRLAAQALEQLWTHLALLPRHVNEKDPFVAAYLKSIRRTVEREAPPPPRRRWMDAALDLSHVMNALEALLLGLIGPQGQSPHPPYSAELPAQPYFEAWLSLRSGSPDLLPGPEARRSVSWRTPRALVPPIEALQILGRQARAVTFDDCRALIDRWNRGSSRQRFLAPADDAERGRFGQYQKRFEEAYAQLSGDLRRIAERGDVYMGWTAWYGHE